MIRLGVAEREVGGVIGAERGARGVLALLLTAFRVPLLAYLGGAGFRRKTIEFPLDLPQLDRPIDLTQGSLLAEGLVGLSVDWSGRQTATPLRSIRNG